MADFVDRVFNKSCAAMSEIPDGAVDAIVASSPYETQRTYSDDPADHGNYRGKEFIEQLRPAMRECFRVLKPEGSAFFNFHHSRIGGFASPTLHSFPALLEDVGFKTVQVLYWLKTNAQTLHDGRVLKPSIEWIYHCAKTDAYFANKDAIRGASLWGGRDHRVHKYNPAGADRGNWFCPALDQLSKLTVQEALQALLGNDSAVLPMRKSQEQASIHCAKMVDELADWLIKYGSKPGDLVLDPWLGSGTSACRAKALGRRWAGYEIVPKFMELARGRIEAVAFGEALGTVGNAVLVSTPQARPKPPATPVPAASMKCRTCGTEFEPKRRWQTSCSSKCRYTHWNRANTHYIRRKTDGKTADVAGGGGSGASGAEDALRVDVEKEDSPQEGSGPGVV